MRLEELELQEGDTLRQSDFEDHFGHGVTGKGIEIRYDDKGQKYLWLFANEEGPYDDDIGTETFRFVGENPQGPGVDNLGEEDQELKRGNKELRDAIDTPLPIFLFYQSTDSNEWEYRGMVDVESFEYKPRDGRYVYEFTLTPIESETTQEAPGGSTAPADSINHDERVPDLHQPERTQVTTSRVIRNTDLVDELKQQYDHTCQICGDQRQRADGESYAEGHHIRPLGHPHNGPDTASNILVLCPNHHADFDYGRIRVDPETYEIEHAYEEPLNGNTLAIEPDHSIEERHLRYHNQGLTQF